MNGTPVVDPRTQLQIVEQAQSLRAVYTPEWNTARADSGTALIAIFARLMEIMISRLNRVPEKNFLAFLDTAGVRLLPPAAARAPLKFVSTAGAKKDAVVPAGTQVATPPLPGREPVTFETEKGLTVSRSRLVQLYAHDPDADRYGNLQLAVILNEANERSPFQPFVGTSLIPHRLYLAHDTVFRIGQRARLTITFTFATLSDAARRVFQEGLRWAIRSTEAEVTPVSANATVNLEARQIVVVLDDAALTAIAATRVDGVDGHWIQAETVTPLPRTVGNVRVQVGIASSAADIKPELAFSNASALDVARPFHPFGERPKLFDAFFLAIPEALNKAGSQVTLDPRYRPGTAGTFGVELTWEFWNGTEWKTLGVSNHSTTSSDQSLPYAFVDHTQAFTVLPGAPADTTIEFTCPAVQPVDVNGKKNYWLRVTITSGNYGKDAEMKLTPEGATKPPEDQRLSDWIFVAASFAPPIVTSLSASYDYTAPQRPTAARTENNFTIAAADPSGDIQPFEAPEERQPAWYLGFDSPFSPQPVSLYVAVEETVQAAGAHVVWEYWDGTGWRNLGAQDSTTNFTESGMVEFIGPAGAAGPAVMFNRHAWWLRARLEAGDKLAPTLLGIFSNTVWARNAVTLTFELLGSSTETPDSVFRLSRFPVLDGLQLEVREPDRPSDDDLRILQEEEGADVVTPVAEGEGALREVWVRWHRVDHFRFSSKRSRHYTADWFNGVVRFGGGARGMAPPAGRDNIRARWYQAGGGSAGNVERNTVTVLKRAIPFVDKAYNVDAAGGGSDGETVEQVKARGPQTIKNRNRAVTWEDYEWLAREASFQVARARALPARSQEDGGTVRLVLVPQSGEMKPYPSQGLIRQVKDYLGSRVRRVGTSALIVTGPKYVEISIAANVVPGRLEEADAVRRRVKDALTEFFHPLRGGPEGNGWAFGRDVFVSEVSKVIEDAAGVHHAEGVEICSSFHEDGRAALSRPPAGGDLTPLLYQVDIADDYLVASGDHLIAVNGVDEPSSDTPFLGNTSTRELHNLRNEQTRCSLHLISPARVRRFSCLGPAIRDGYDLCAYCFGRELSQR